MEKRGSGAQASKFSKQQLSSKKRKLVAKFTDSDYDEDNATLLFKFKNLKSTRHVASVAVTVGDIGQAPSTTFANLTNTEGVGP